MSDLKCTTVFVTTVVLQDKAELDTRASRKVGFSQQVTDPLPDCKQKESPEDIGETDQDLHKSALDKLLEDMAHKFKSSLGDIVALEISERQTQTVVNFHLFNI